MGCRSLESPMPTGAGHRAALLVHLLLLLFCHSLIFHLFILYSLECSLLGPFSFKLYNSKKCDAIHSKAHEQTFSFIFFHFIV